MKAVIPTNSLFIIVSITIPAHVETGIVNTYIISHETSAFFTEWFSIWNVQVRMQSSFISFIDLYAKVWKNFPEARTVAREERLHLGEKMVQIAGEHGMIVKPCGEGDELEKFGADCNGCMTRETYETALHTHLDIPNRKPLRKECACFMGNDIGVYNTCPHMCRYCYANYDEESVRRNYRFHDPKSPFLIGGSLPWDAEVHEAEQHSWIDGQITLDMLFGI